ncbi:MAG: hypothetical protein LBH69_03835 [Methanomassiliicoccaceae archaeon]|jgi:hypothetical protein|nr:hypothetical protein [Methanomassiliicoccaceae archaeon]
MDNEDVMNIVIEIPSDERILKEGVLRTVRLNKKPLRFVLKYALTEKGLWTRNKRTFFLKPKTTFIPYSDIEFYESTVFMDAACLLFHPKGREPYNALYFDDPDGACAVFGTYVAKKPE